MQQLIKFKIVFVGDQSVGKTSIIQRFVADKFNEHGKVGPPQSS